MQAGRALNYALVKALVGGESSMVTLQEDALTNPRCAAREGPPRRHRSRA
jgi:hypothetical protein